VRGQGSLEILFIFKNYRQLSPTIANYRQRWQGMKVGIRIAEGKTTLQALGRRLVGSRKAKSKTPDVVSYQIRFLIGRLGLILDDGRRPDVAVPGDGRAPAGPRLRCFLPYAQRCIHELSISQRRKSLTFLRNP
jgi:hypothetical protein